MKTTELRGVSFPVPKFCFGCAFLGNTIPEETSFEILDTFYAHGGRFFNTSHAYGDGKSEETLGRWIRQRGLQNQVLVTTKCGEDRRFPLRCQDLRAPALRLHITESLDRLMLDHVDFFLLHVDDNRTGVDEILETLEELVKEGKIRHYGCSNWSIARQRDAALYARLRGYQGFVMDEIEFHMTRSNLTNRDTSMWLDESYIAFHEEDGVCVAGYSPLASGCLSKLAQDGDTRNFRPLADRFLNAYTYEVAKRLRTLSKETGWSVTQLQLAWLLDPPYQFPSFLILGASKPAQLEDSMRAFEVKLTPDMIAYLHPPFEDYPD